MKISFICDFCNKEGFKHQRHLNENERLGHKNYCSRSCMGKDRKKYIITECSECKKEIDKPLNQLKRSKSGEVFCSRSCACIYNNKNLRQGVNHPNYVNGNGSYREIALRELGAKCFMCNYSNKPALEVHHKDGNRENNKIENLIVLCPNHHREIHFGYEL